MLQCADTGKEKEKTSRITHLCEKSKGQSSKFYLWFKRVRGVKIKKCVTGIHTHTNKHIYIHAHKLQKY